MPTHQIDCISVIVQESLIPVGGASMSDRRFATHSLLATRVRQKHREVDEALLHLGQAVDVVARAVFALSTATPASTASGLVCA